MATKYCFVLSCLNNSKKNPEKYFYAVPKNKDTRENWCQAVQRRKESLGFNGFENIVQNYDNSIFVSSGCHTCETKYQH